MGYLSFCTSACCLIIIGCFTAQTHCDNVTTNPRIFSAVHITVPDYRKAKELALSILNNKMAATVNMVSRVRSAFIWSGRMKEEVEFLLMFHTRELLMTDIVNHVKNIHPYEVCEVIATRLTDGNDGLFGSIVNTVPMVLVQNYSWVYKWYAEPRSKQIENPTNRH